MADLGYLTVALVTSVFVGIPPNSEHSFIVSFHDNNSRSTEQKILICIAVELWDGCFRSLWPGAAVEQHDWSFGLYCHLYDHQQGTLSL